MIQGTKTAVAFVWAASVLLALLAIWAGAQAGPAALAAAVAVAVALALVALRFAGDIRGGRM